MLRLIEVSASPLTVEERERAAAEQSQARTSDGSPTAASPFQSLSAEALNFGDRNDEEDLDLKAQNALECPCVADLQKGPCGNVFSKAFVCYIKSTAVEKGSDCVKPFLAMQACMLENPDAFSRYVNLEPEENQEAEEHSSSH